MATFKAGDREWRVRLTIGLIAQLRTDAKFELGKELEGEDFARALFLDMDRLLDVLWVVCRGEAEAAGLARDQFFAPFGGEELDAASTAFMEAIIDFFQRGRAPAMKAKLPGVMAAANAKIGAAMGAEIDALSKSLAGGSPASSGSTPAT